MYIRIFLKVILKKKVILLNQCLKIAFGKAETTDESGGFLLKQSVSFY